MLDMHDNAELDPVYEFHHRLYTAQQLIGTKIQSETVDTLVELEIYKYFSPRSVWEFGAGTGSWAIAMNYLSGHSAKFSMTENFTFVTVDYLQKYRTDNQFWPETIKELSDHLDNSNSKLGVHMEYELYDKDICHYLNDITTPFEFVRLDCDLEMPHKTIEHIIENSTDNLVIISDDVEPNGCLNRLMLLQEQVAKGKLRIFWTGVCTAAWCKPSVDIEPFFDNMEIYRSAFKEMFVLGEYTSFGLPQQHLITRG
jgi:hypothetical protein